MGSYADLRPKIEESIAKLHEYRVALISAAVMGKIDVRESTETVTPERRANPFFRRSVLAAEIVHRLHNEPTFGRVKLQKLLHLCEYHAQLAEIESSYYRDTNGPHDNQLMRSVESQLRQQRWYGVVGRGRVGFQYIPLEQTGGHSKYFDRYFRHKRAAIDEVLNLFRQFDTQRCEIVSTLYAAWNDLLLTGQEVTDEAILKEVLEHWHDSKRDIPEVRWRNALAWMREHRLVPVGFGKPTRQKEAE